MTLEELLDELRDGILHDITDQIDGATSQLWSDRRLVRYINEAQRRYARRALILRDGTTPEVVEFRLRTGVNQYSLHPSVLAVISAKVDGDVADLARAGHSAFDTYRQPDPYFFDPSSLSALAPGKPLAFGTDEYLVADDDGSNSVVSFRVYPTPDATANGKKIRMRVCRMPLNKLTTEDLQAVPEIPDTLHLEMLDWAAYLALRTIDVDQGLPERAAEFRASFEAHVDVAKREMMRKLFTPAQWGFGRNGFSWEK